MQGSNRHRGLEDEALVGIQGFIEHLPDILGILAALISTLGASLVATGFAVVLKKYRITGIIKSEGVDREEVERIRSEIASARSGDPIPFEIEQLANYYSVTLGQAKVSFWFSLLFASIGFIVIIGAAFLYRDGDALGASIKVTSGVIIDAVAALFFVQSRRAQEAMGAFFEKLRTDRQFIEARKICEEITNDTIKDNLKTILVLHYSGLQSTGMLDVLAGVTPINHSLAAGHPGQPRAIAPRSLGRKAKPSKEAVPPGDGAAAALGA
jgi:hypothetical protein